VLKYKDTDGDLITLTSNEELSCALSYSDGALLRLVVALKADAPVTTESDVPVCSSGFPCSTRGRCHGGENMHGCPRRFHGRGWEHMRGGHGHHGWEHMRGGHGHHGWHGHNHGGHGGWGPEMFKARLTSKRDFLKSRLDELEKVPEKTPEQQQDVLWLQTKLKRIESRLERGWEKKEMKGKHCGKWAEKRRQKMEKREKKDKYCTQNLSEETQTQIAMLKSQIDVFKPVMKEVKSQIKTKKNALKEAKATGGDPHQLIKELLALKEKRISQKNEVKPLKQKICELKYASC